MIMKHEQRHVAVRSFLVPLSVSGYPKNFVCLFSQNQIVEFIESRFIHPIPRSPNYLKGVLWHHDNLLPVIDLDELCNPHPSVSHPAVPLPAVQENRYRQFVVVRTGAVDPETGMSLKAIIAAKDRVRIARLSGKALEDTFEQQAPPPSLIQSGLVRGCFRHEDDSILLLDLGPVVQGAYTSA